MCACCCAWWSRSRSSRQAARLMTPLLVVFAFKRVQTRGANCTQANAASLLLARIGHNPLFPFHPLYRSEQGRFDCDAATRAPARSTNIHASPSSTPTLLLPSTMQPPPAAPPAPVLVHFAARRLGLLLPTHVPVFSSAGESCLGHRSFAWNRTRHRV